MRVVGLFAGIGGLEVGLAGAGHNTVMMCEIWEPARAVLSTRFPHTDLERNIVELRDFPSGTEVVVAGFPCQDLSQAGMTAGIAGKRSGLVGHVFRLLDKRTAPWVVLENVSFMLQLDSGRGLQMLVDAFEERGYRWAYRVVNSMAFLPQRRERVLFVATTTDVDPATVLLADDVEPRKSRTSLSTHAHGFYWTEGIRGLGWARDAIPTLKNGSTIGIASPPAILLPNGQVITPDIRDAERLQGFEAGWTEPAGEVSPASLRWSLSAMPSVCLSRNGSVSASPNLDFTSKIGIANSLGEGVGRKRLGSTATDDGASRSVRFQSGDEDRRSRISSNAKENSCQRGRHGVFCLERTEALCDLCRAFLNAYVSTSNGWRKQGTPISRTMGFPQSLLNENLSLW